MTDPREFWRGVAVGVLLMSAIAVGILQLQETRSLEANDHRADSLQAQLDTAAMKSAQDSIEHARLGAIADSSSAAARRALAARPRPTFTVAPDTTPAVEGDTVQRALIMRAIDPVPFKVPQFLIDQLQEQEQALGYAMRAWQSSEKARLFADSVYIPDLRRQLDESGKVIRAERDRVADRDRKLARNRKRDLVTKAALAVVTLIAIAK